MSDWRLFTGVTGLLGQYLLFEALGRREPVVVLVRGRRGMTAFDRVDQILGSWEKRHGKSLQRPIVLEGDLRAVGLGLSNYDSKWFRRNVKSIVHSAASVRFQETAAGEPMKSNLEGTRNLLDVCGNSSVDEFHYISTAYSCGKIQTSGSVLEELHPLHGPFGNIYEESKCRAEHLVSEYVGGFTRTIYRPSVVVGESISGYSPSFNAIYTPLRLIWLMLRDSASHIQSKDDLLHELDLDGDELRNIVPVDWVCRAINSLIREPTLHGRIYHLTNPIATNGNDILSAMVSALATCDSKVPKVDRLVGNVGRKSLTEFREHMQAYRSYFVSDPKFDNSQFRAARICEGCPVVDERLLTCVFAYAVRTQFTSDQYEVHASADSSPRRFFESNMKNASDVGLPNDTFETIANDTTEESNRLSDVGPRDDSIMGVVPAFVTICLSGLGGGQWRISFDSDQMICERPDDLHGDNLQLYSTATAFRKWIAGEFSFEDGLRIGAFVMTGGSHDLDSVRGVMEKLACHVLAMKDDSIRDFNSEPPEFLVASRETLAAGVCHAG